MSSAGLSFVSGEETPPLRNMSIGDVLRSAYEQFPAHEAIVSVWQGRALTYSQLYLLVCQAANALAAHGIRAGDRVGIWSANRIEWVIVQFAAAQLGAILVNINPAYRQTELEQVIEHSKCAALFLAPSYRGFDCVSAACHAKSKSPALRHLFLLDDVPREGAISWGEFMTRGSSSDPYAQRVEEAGIAPTSAASIQYTSGTTGAPKGATLSHHNLVNNCYAIGARMGLKHSDRICLPVPMFHCFGMGIGVLGAVAYGATVVFPGETFDAGGCLAAVEREKCTAIYAVPMMFIAMLNHADFDPSKLASLRTGLMGGAPCPVEILRAARERMHMREVAVLYGMTETSPISFQGRPHDELEQRVQTVGAVQSHVQAKIIDPVSGETLPVGQQGELCVRGYLVMLGYWENAAATSKAIDRDGWMHTGDLAVMREDRYVAIVGRIKDMVIRGGENIFPREIEEFLYTVEGVEDAQVFGVPDAIYGEQLCAWVRPKANARLDGDILRARCKGRIASFKIPAVFRIVSEFPTTASGKVQKFRMREMELERIRADEPATHIRQTDKNVGMKQ
jgi:fatty-acyl-CoA synthase